MYNSEPFTDEEVKLIESSFADVLLAQDETPLSVVRSLFSRFPNQNLDTAIGGALDEKKHRQDKTETEEKENLGEVPAEAPTE